MFALMPVSRESASITMVLVDHHDLARRAAPGDPGVIGAGDGFALLALAGGLTNTRSGCTTLRPTEER